ncbi:SRPBCC family protein [Nostocoides sp. Soil756]|uniref:SRPBCC family protein n=1 Tax=Nostocoides sp. Soil756 TaxID=1736399 RepID=UPI000A8B2A35|nr:SRPBCC family protein [Tetrasphaera sp. Soil756]
MTTTNSTPSDHTSDGTSPAAETGSGGVRVLGTLRTADGTGVVHLEDRYATGPDDLWSALTDPDRLRRWLGEVEGDLRPGGGFTAHFFASGWEGTGRVEVCEPPRRLVVHTSSPDQPEGVIEAVLTPDGDGTRLVVEDRGMPLDQLPAYGAGDQIHLEDLRAVLAGNERCDARARWQELNPAYQELAVEPR